MLSSARRPQALAKVALLAGFAGLVATATQVNAQASCDWYAKTALQQQQENQQKKCGFTGPAWSTDLKVHMTWCAAQAPEVWKAEAQKRAQQLTTCK